VAPTDPSRCSVASLQRGDPQAGTAPVASRWLLVEHQGPWAKKPMDTEPLLGPVGAEVDERAASLGGRVLLVRRPGRRAPGAEEHHWYAVDTVRRTWVRGTWRTPADLLDAARALGDDLSASQEEAEPMVLVCTHGVRDACCAVRGRPIVTTLARALPEQVWECTHLGGHRFAPTAVLLPTGYAYGRLDAAAGARLLSRASVVTENCRGRSTWPAAGQVAELAMRERTGELDPDALTVVGVDRSCVLVAHRDGRQWQVTVVEREVAPARPASCTAAPTPAVGLAVAGVRAA
jgi:hypothetical protein